MWRSPLGCSLVDGAALSSPVTTHAFSLERYAAHSRLPVLVLACVYQLPRPILWGIADIDCASVLSRAFWPELSSDGWPGFLPQAACSAGYSDTPSNPLQTSLATANSPRHKPRLQPYVSHVTNNHRFPTSQNFAAAVGFPNSQTSLPPRGPRVCGLGHYPSTTLRHCSTGTHCSVGSRVSTRHASCCG